MHTEDRRCNALRQQQDPQYDDAGSLVQDEKWLYTWGGRGRLIRMIPAPAAHQANQLAGKPSHALEFDYDSRCRRIHKLVKAYDPSKAFSAMTKVSQSAYLYDGWNVVAEYRHSTLSGTAAWRREWTYLWGPDTSGSDQGAGGVGGLVMAMHHNPSGTPSRRPLRPVYDTNGNVQAWVNLTTGQVSHRIQYDAFGRELSQVNHTTTASSSGIPIPPLRFSTKYTDGETGLVYFGYRYYAPELGRWASKDPIGERGGINLYGMVENDPVNKRDYLGLLRIVSREFPSDCGAYKVTFLFQLDQPAASAGYLVQEINKTVEITDCATGKTSTKTTRFWESWMIPRGAQIPSGKGERGNDTSGRVNQGCTKGKVISDGTLKFVPYSTTGLLGTGFPSPYRQDGSWGLGNESTFPYTDVIDPSQPGHPDSGILPSTREQPPWWNERSNENGWRKVEAEWDCCGARAERAKTRLQVTHS